ncbi:MAG: hypothetical protein VB013_04770 [Anaerolineaceae bacterium]|nr:hypothetical protein [Anaerolineaceae bacterium]
MTEGKWRYVPTTLERLDGSEGRLYACALPQTGGTFALFGAYIGPAEPKATSRVPATLTPAPSSEPSLTPSAEPSMTATATQTPTAVDTDTPIASVTPSATVTVTATETATTEEPLTCPIGCLLVGDTCLPPPMK